MKLGSQQEAQTAIEALHGSQTMPVSSFKCSSAHSIQNVVKRLLGKSLLKGFISNHFTCVMYCSSMWRCESSNIAVQGGSSTRVVVVDVFLQAVGALG